MMGLKQKPIPKMTDEDRRLILRIIFQSKNLYGSDFEGTVNLVKKIQEQLQRAGEK